MRTAVISLGGSLIVPEGIDTDFLKKFRAIILELISKGDRFVIVCGGGRTCRVYQNASSEITEVNKEDRDWIGIAATRLNAELVRSVFSEQAYERIIDNPADKIVTEKKIIIGAGHVPGSSSDLDAVILAENSRADTLINMSNIDMVYDKDPKTHKDAKPIDKITWDDFLKLVGEEWIPGANVPFDPVASKKAKDLGLKVIVLNGNNLDNLKDFLEGREFVGTLIS